MDNSTLSLPRCRARQAASAAIASRVPVSLRLNLALSATMLRTWRIQHGIRVFERDEDAVCIDNLGNCAYRFARIDQQSNGHGLPSSKPRLSSARTSPQSKSLLMTKPSRTPVLDCAVMV